MIRRIPDRLIVAAIVAAGLTIAVSMLERWTSYGDLTNWTYDFLVNHGAMRPPPKTLSLSTSMMPPFRKSTSFRFHAPPLPM